MYNCQIQLQPGTSALHLAIAYKNTDLTEFLLAHCANVHQRACGAFFLPFDQQLSEDSGEDNLKEISDYNSLCYLGEYPLAWAVSYDDKMTYNLLIQYGADPNSSDSFGNMILHIIVIKERLNWYTFALRHPVRSARNDLTNVNGFTPLTLACSIGRDRIFTEIVELSCYTIWNYSKITCCGYPLSLIDSIQLIYTQNGELIGEPAGTSALSLIGSGSTDSHVEMLNGGIVQKLLDEKWKAFGYVSYFSILLSTLTLTSIYPNFTSHLQSDRYFRLFTCHNLLQLPFHNGPLHCSKTHLDT